MGTFLLLCIIIALGVTGLGNVILFGLRELVRGAKKAKKYINDETDDKEDE